MSVTDNYSPVTLVGNGVSVEISGNWPIVSSDALVLELREVATGVITTLVLGVDYTLTFDTSGWLATIISGAPAVGFNVVGYRDLSLIQPTPYRTVNGFDGSVHERSFDRLTIIAQDLRDDIERSVRTRPGDPQLKFLPTASARRALLWDDDENGFVNSEFDPDEIITDSAANAAAAEAAKNAAVIAQGESEDARDDAVIAQSAAEVAAAQAVAAAAEGLYNNIVTITFADSPFTPTTLQEGWLFRCDTSGGPIVVDLSTLATYGEDMKFAFAKTTGDANTITVNRGGTDTINGGTSKVLSLQYVTETLLGDFETGSWISNTGLVDNSIPLSKIAQIPANTFLGNNTGGVADVIALTVAQALAALGLIDDDTFATATSTNFPSAESVKAYVDGKATSGTWTPQYTSSGAAVITHSVQSGEWFLRDGFCFAFFTIQTSSISGGSGTDSINLDGLPFTTKTSLSSLDWAGLMFFVRNFSASTTHPMAARVVANQQRAALYRRKSADARDELDEIIQRSDMSNSAGNEIRGLLIFPVA